MEDTDWVEEGNVDPSSCKKRKRRIGKKKVEFIDWGSRPLIEFLQAIDKDIKEKYSQHEVAEFILKYISEECLAIPGKKKKVRCDAKLFNLFGKSTMLRTKVYDMLEEHFAENHGSSDDESMDSSDDEQSQKKKKLNPVKEVQAPPKSCFAAVIAHNIELVYLAKNVILELFNDRESFVSKIVGSFIRTKADKYDITQKNKFVLQLVTGVENFSEEGDAGKDVDDIHLKVANSFKSIPVSMLSIDKFSEEEIEDVRDRIKTGALKRLTVAELEVKAQMLHQHVTKDLIARELRMIQPKLDRANDKGWRREYFDLLDRRKLLETPSEVEKMLLKKPEVIAEELEPEPVPEVEPEVEPDGTTGASEEAKRMDSSPISDVKESLNVSGMEDFITSSQVIVNGFDVPPEQNGSMVNGVICTSPNGPECTNGTPKQVEERGTGDLVSPTEVISNDLDGFQLPEPLHIPWHEEFESEVVIIEPNAPQVQNEDMVNGVIAASSPKGHACASEMPKQVELKGNECADELPKQEEMEYKYQYAGPSKKAISGSNPTDNGNIQEVNIKENSPEEKQEDVIANSEEQEPVQAIVESGERSRNEKPAPVVVIELSDDESEDERHETEEQVVAMNVAMDVAMNVAMDVAMDVAMNVAMNVAMDVAVGDNNPPDNNTWHYVDPCGNTQGPFSLDMLRQWNEAGFFYDDFRVWRNGQTSDSAILLVEALRQNNLIN